MEKKTVLIQDLSINFDLPQCNLSNEVFTKAINFTCVNGKFVTTNESAPAPVASEKGPWAALPTGATAIALSLLYHFDSYPFVEETGALINQASNLPAQLLTTGQTFGAGAFRASYGSGHPELGNGLHVTYLNSDPDYQMQPNFTIRFRYTPTISTAGGATTVLDVGNPINMYNVTNTGFHVFRGFPNVTGLTLNAGQSYAISLEAYNNNGYLYIDGSLVHTFVDLQTNCYASYSYSSPLIFNLGATTNDVAEAPIFDEFAFINGTALAAGASSYTVETTPYTGVIYV